MSPARPAPRHDHRVIVFALLLAAIPAGDVLAAAHTPPALSPEAIRRALPATGPTLDMRMAADPAATLASGEHMCGTTRAHADFDAALRAGRPVALAPGESSRLTLPLPKTYMQNGVIVIEDNGTILRNDNVVDLVGTSLRFTPNGTGFDAVLEPLSYDAALGSKVIDNVQSFFSVQHSLSFSFPFGPASYSDIWVATNLGVYFSSPVARGGSQLLAGDVLFDRTPRVGPMIQGQSLYGYTVFVREDADRVVVTWQSGGLDVQMTLFAGGDILMSYPSFPVEWGSPTVVTGNDSWWADLQTRGTQTDPVGDTAEDPSLDLIAVTARQIRDSQLFTYEIDLAGAVPLTTDTYYWDLYLFRTPTDPNPLVYYIYYENGVVTATNASSVIVAGPKVTIGIFGVPGDLPVRAGVNNWIYQGGWRYSDGAAVDSITITGAEPTMLDLSTLTTPFSTDGPVFEAFTIPALEPYEVLRVMQAYFGPLEWDGVPIFQNLDTDIIFYAGGYSTVGNAGADGIGVGSSADPLGPAMLHMNRIHYGWNSWREGRTLLINQEFGHHWLYFARIDDGGVESTIVNPDGAHYAGWVHTKAAQPVFYPDDASSLGGAYWTDNGDGSFVASDLRCYPFNWVDLYLLGLADPTEVDTLGEWWYIKDPIPQPAAAYWPSAGFRVDTGIKTPLSIQQIIDNEGPRVPAYPATKRAMQVPYVLVGRPGRIPIADIDTVATYCSDWVGDWSASTLGRSTVDCGKRLNQAPDGIVLTPAASVSIGVGDALNFTATWSDIDGDPVTWAWNFAGVIADSTLRNPGLVTFPAAGVYSICLTVTDIPGLPDPEPACVVVSVCSAPATLANTLLMARDKSTNQIIAHWSNLVGVADYPLFAAATKPGPFTTEVAAGADGAIGIGMPWVALPNRFYRIAGREGNCVGSID